MQTTAQHKLSLHSSLHSKTLSIILVYCLGEAASLEVQLDQISQCRIFVCVGVQKQLLLPGEVGIGQFLMHPAVCDVL